MMLTEWPKSVNGQAFTCQTNNGLITDEELISELVKRFSFNYLYYDDFYSPTLVDPLDLFYLNDQPGNQSKFWVVVCEKPLVIKFNNLSIPIHLLVKLLNMGNVILGQADVVYFDSNYALGAFPQSEENLEQFFTFWYQISAYFFTSLTDSVGYVFFSKFPHHQSQVRELIQDLGLSRWPKIR